MDRNSFMMDLLKPRTIQDIVDDMDHKQELTSDDIQKIIDTAEKVIAAGVTIQRRT